MLTVGSPSAWSFRCTIGVTKVPFEEAEIMTMSSPDETMLAAPVPLQPARTLSLSRGRTLNADDTSRPPPTASIVTRLTSSGTTYSRADDVQGNVCACARPGAASATKTNAAAVTPVRIPPTPPTVPPQP